VCVFVCLCVAGGGGVRALTRVCARAKTGTSLANASISEGIVVFIFYQIIKTYLINVQLFVHDVDFDQISRCVQL
jgi:hypothetical protein